MKDAKLTLTQEWDKTFPRSEKTDHRKVTFHNRYGITLAADMYTPKNMSGRLAAIAVCGPFGAVKEQCAAFTHRHLQNVDSSLSLSIRRSPERAAVSQDMSLLPISIQKIFRRQLTSFRYRKMSIRNASESSVYAAGAEWL